jgi:hypothetical protein
VGGQDADLLRRGQPSVPQRAAAYDAWYETPLGRAMDADEARAAAYLPPAAPGWLVRHADSLERRGRRLGSAGAAFSIARGEIPALPER